MNILRSTKYDILYIHPSVKLDIIEPQLHHIHIIRVRPYSAVAAF